MTRVQQSDLQWTYATHWVAPGTNRQSGQKFYFLGLVEHKQTGELFLVRNWGAGYFIWSDPWLFHVGQFKVERSGWNQVLAEERRRGRSGYDLENKTSFTSSVVSAKVTSGISNLLGLDMEPQLDPEPHPVPELTVEMMTAVELLAEPVTTDVYAELIRRRAEAISEIDAKRVAIAELEELKHLFEMKIRG